MHHLQIKTIKPKIVGVLGAAGYKFIQQQCYERWTRDRNNCVWFSKQVVRATSNTISSDIIRGVAGVADRSVSEAQQGKYDSWYTDGYRSRGTATI